MQIPADLRSGFRQFRRAPAFSAVVVATLALGIGANTAIFSAIYGAFLARLPFHEPRALVMVWEDASYVGFPRNTPAPGNYFEWKRLNQVFTDMAATRGQSANLTTEGPPEQVLGRGVTANFFSVLGVAPALGRAFSEDEDRDGASVVVISDGLWRRRYGADPAIVGRAIPMSGLPRTVVGVMPRGFVFRNRDIDFWVPAHFTAEEQTRRTSHFLNVVARLRPEATPASAQLDMDRVARQLAKDYPADNARIGAVVAPLRDDLLGDTSLELLVLMAAAGAVLLIACANVASLLLARAVTRRGELAIRVSLGASRARLWTQMIVEGLGLSLAGGLCGLLLAPLATQLIADLVPTSLPGSGPLLSTPLLLFATVLSVATGLALSLTPALQVSSVAMADTLKQSGRGLVGRHRVGRWMVVGQVAVALALVICTGLFLKTLGNLRRIDLGFKFENVLTLRTTLPREKYRDASRRRAFYERVLADARNLPGVAAAAYGSTLPFQSIGNTNSYRIDAGQTSPGDARDALFRVGSADYLRTLSATLLSGRLIDDRDGPDAPLAVVVNETLARRHWPAGDALAHRVTFARDEDDGPWYTIVGVVRDVRERGYEREMKPGVYLSYVQLPETWAMPETLVVRTAGDPRRLTADLRRIIASADPEQPVAAVRTLDEIVDLDVADRAQQLTLLSGFAGLALFLAGLGLYGILAYSVAERRHEIGLRMALGASVGRVMRQVVTAGLRLTLLGCLLGLTAGLLSARAFRSLLYGVSTSDPGTIVSAVAIFVGISLLAAAIPAFRAARVDPMRSLRQE